MPNETDLTIDVRGSVEVLHRLEHFGRQLTRARAAAPETDAEHAAKSAEYFRLQEALPRRLFLLLRDRIRTGLPLVAPCRGARCTRCHTALPSQGHINVLAGREPVLCSFCGVLLFAGEDETAGLTPPL